MRARGEQGCGVSINNGGPMVYASSGENPCESWFFMLDNSSWGGENFNTQLIPEDIFIQTNINSPES